METMDLTELVKATVSANRNGWQKVHSADLKKLWTILAVNITAIYIKCWTST